MGALFLDLVEFIMKRDLRAGLDVLPNDQFVSGVGQMNDRVHFALEERKPRPAIRLQHIKRAEQDSAGVFLLFEDINRGEVGLKPDHVDRLGNVIVHFIARTVYEDVQFEGVHEPILIPIVESASVKYCNVIIFPLIWQNLIFPKRRRVLQEERYSVSLKIIR